MEVDKANVMNRSESIENLAKAFVKFQSEVTNPANTADNPFFKSKYAPLNEVLNLVRPILTKYGLSIIQSPSAQGDSVTVTTMILHESGEWIRLDPLTLKADKNTAQGIGSAITYARRYALSAALGISSEDDDDGNIASGNKQDYKNKQAKPQQLKSNVQPKPNNPLASTIAEIDKLAREKAQGNREAVIQAITKHHDSANYNTIADIEIAKRVLAELQQLQL